MGPVIDLPDAVQAMAARGPEWATWVDRLPKLVQSQLDDWNLIPEGAPTHGYCSVVLPARTPDGVAAVLKIAFPDDVADTAAKGKGSRQAFARADPQRNR